MSGDSTKEQGNQLKTGNQPPELGGVSPIPSSQSSLGIVEEMRKVDLTDVPSTSTDSSNSKSTDPTAGMNRSQKRLFRHICSKFNVVEEQALTVVNAKPCTNRRKRDRSSYKRPESPASEPVVKGTTTIVSRVQPAKRPTITMAKALRMRRVGIIREHDYLLPYRIGHVKLFPTGSEERNPKENKEILDDPEDRAPKKKKSTNTQDRNEASHSGSTEPIVQNKGKKTNKGSGNGNPKPIVGQPTLPETLKKSERAKQTPNRYGQP